MGKTARIGNSLTRPPELRGKMSTDGGSEGGTILTSAAAGPDRALASGRTAGPAL